MMKRMIPVGAMVVALSLAGVAADAGQRDNQGRDRNGRESRGDAQRDSGRRDDGQQQQRAEAPRAQAPREAPRAEAQREAPREVPREAQRESPRAEAPRAEANRGNRDQAVPRGQARGDARGDARRDNGQDRGRYVAPPPRDYRYDNRGNDRRDAYRYDNRDNGRYYPFRYAPVPRYYGPDRRPRYYGSGGSYSVYFGVGNGYLYGSPYLGRVYGYAGPRSYGSRIYYGDLRLQVRPRNAAVYVDGYYAGIVDDFDGVFQRLTLEVGPHEIELDAPGLEPQLFDVYIDPAQTVTLRSDLY